MTGRNPHSKSRAKSPFTPKILLLLPLAEAKRLGYIAGMTRSYLVKLDELELHAVANALMDVMRTEIPEEKHVILQTAYTALIGAHELDTPTARRIVAQDMGIRGGISRSDAKVAAAKENGKAPKVKVGQVYRYADVLRQDMTWTVIDTDPFLIHLQHGNEIRKHSRRELREYFLRVS